MASGSTDHGPTVYGPMSPNQPMVPVSSDVDKKSHQKADELEAYWQMGLFPSDVSVDVCEQAQQIPVPEDGEDDLQEELCEEEFEVLRNLRLR